MTLNLWVEDLGKILISLLYFFTVVSDHTFLNFRVNWAFGNAVKLTPRNREAWTQVHVSFATSRLDAFITEEYLDSLFGKYGEIADVTVKKHLRTLEPPSQSGYAFVYFFEGSAGIAAVQELKRVFIDEIRLECSLSYRSEQAIQAVVAASASPFASKIVTNNMSSFPGNVGNPRGPSFSHSSNFDLPDTSFASLNVGKSSSYMSTPSFESNPSSNDTISEGLPHPNLSLNTSNNWPTPFSSFRDASTSSSSGRSDYLVRPPVQDFYIPGSDAPSPMYGRRGTEPSPRGAVSYSLSSNGNNRSPRPVLGISSYQQHLNHSHLNTFNSGAQQPQQRKMMNSSDPFDSFASQDRSYPSQFQHPMQAQAPFPPGPRHHLDQQQQQHMIHQDNFFPGDASYPPATFSNAQKSDFNNVSRSLTSQDTFGLH